MISKSYPFLKFKGVKIWKREKFILFLLDREIYCRKSHSIKEPLSTDCNNCPCFAGWEQGHGHECVWEDIVDEPVIKHKDRYKEFERIDKLIKQGILKSNVCDEFYDKYDKK